MSDNQVKNGKAFEYACILAFENELKKRGSKVIVINSSPLSVAKSFFTEMNPTVQNDFLLAGNAAYKILSKLEPFLEQPNDSTIVLALQPDNSGQNGDVRDLLFIRNDFNWSIGLSLKHNHEAVKHSRLSDVLDFGKQWLGIPCSKQYFDEIQPIFNNLRKLKIENIAWSEIKNKDSQVYIPLLNAFIKELTRLSNLDDKVPHLLLEYLLGKHDFYKIISHSQGRETEVQAFSLHGGLNLSYNNVKPIIKLPTIKLPSAFFRIAMKKDSVNTVEVVCDQGWQISFRIHNASTLVEPSLKFDIQLVGHPSIYTHHESWMLNA